MKGDYWNGTKNRSVRYYFYVQKGLALLNELRYLVMAIMGIYVIFKFNNPLLMPLMFFASVPILVFFGWLDVHHMAKIMEFLNIKYSTHYSKRNYDLQEERNILIKELLKELKNQNEPIYTIKKLTKEIP